jgi:hypothetical protein
MFSACKLYVRLLFESFRSKLLLKLSMRFKLAVVSDRFEVISLRKLIILILRFEEDLGKWKIQTKIREIQTKIREIQIQIRGIQN